MAVPLDDRYDTWANLHAGAQQAKAAPEPILPSEEVNRILEEAAKISATKRADYAGEDPDENFIRSAKFSALVCHDLSATDPRRSTAVLIGVKLARLMTLGLAPGGNHESINDTLTDLVNYVAILKRQQMRASRGALPGTSHLEGNP